MKTAVQTLGLPPFLKSQETDTHLSELKRGFRTGRPVSSSTWIFSAILDQSRSLPSFVAPTVYCLATCTVLRNFPAKLPPRRAHARAGHSSPYPVPRPETSKLARPSTRFCEVSRKLQQHQFHKLYNDNCCFFLSMTHLLHLSWMLEHQPYKN